MNLGKYIFAMLSADATLTTLVGTRIYPVFLPQAAAYPAIVYTVVNAPLDRQKDATAFHDRAVVTFHIWADALQSQDAYNALDDIDSALRAALDFVEGTAGGVTAESCEYEGSRDGRDEERTLFLREAIYKFITLN